MEERAFDLLTRALAGGTRRRLLRLLAGFPVAGLLHSGKVAARPGQRHQAHQRHHHARTHRRQEKREDAHGEACIPTGKPCRSKKPRGHTRQGNARLLSCKQCCQRHVVQEDGGATCACKPEGLTCGDSSQCCLGVCRNGACNAVTSTPPPTCSGPSLGQTCAVGGAPCCTDISANVQCAGGHSATTTCQDCTSPPTADGNACGEPRGNQCCDGDPTCFVGVTVDTEELVCLSSFECQPSSNPCLHSVDTCTAEENCCTVDTPLCVQVEPGSGCCGSGETTMCAAACGADEGP